MGLERKNISKVKGEACNEVQVSSLALLRTR